MTLWVWKIKKWVSQIYIPIYSDPYKLQRARFEGHKIQVLHPNTQAIYREEEAKGHDLRQQQAKSWSIGIKQFSSF